MSQGLGVHSCWTNRAWCTTLKIMGFGRLPDKEKIISYFFLELSFLGRVREMDQTILRQKNFVREQTFFLLELSFSRNFLSFRLKKNFWEKKFWEKNISRIFFLSEKIISEKKFWVEIFFQKKNLKERKKVLREIKF